MSASPVEETPLKCPPLECDIVMKGGITSGVVYPGAVLKLKERYRFRSIGGASAGGIAAAVVAAAEHNRLGGGFDVVAKLPETLKKPRIMLQLFQPDRSTRPLFEALIGFIEHGKLFGALMVPVRLWPAPLAAALVAVASIALSWAGDADAAFAVAGVGAAILLFLVGLAAEAWHGIGRLNANAFGLCRLGPGVGTEEKPALTAWLHELIQDAAGRSRDDLPLTCAELWGIDPLPKGADDEQRAAHEEEVIARSRDPKQREVDLQMMTTDLTHGRPMRLPAQYALHGGELEEGRGLLFKREEMAGFFPEAVVDRLVDLAPRGPAPAGPPPPGFTRFPIGPDLPVIVATRMSLSFPVLISALPLWELGPGGEPRRVIFSDGGITSNFPIHFFDSLLPSRPTFGLQLTGFPPGENAPEKLEDQCEAVTPPGPVADQAPVTTAVIEDLFGFFTAIKDALQNWRDNAQSQLPGFRDRIAHIKLARGEGGLNLAMDAKVVGRLNKRGECAGEDLIELFVGDGTSPARHWNDHRFTRFRVAMSALERVLRGYEEKYDWPINKGDLVTTPYVERIAAGGDPPFALGPKELKFAQTVTDAYRELVGTWGEGDNRQTLDDAGVPLPPSVLRAVPPV